MKAMKQHILIAGIFVLLLVSGCTKGPTGKVIIENTGNTEGDIQTFKETGDVLCADSEGKPIIRLFATSWCPHCGWIKSTYLKVTDEYVKDNKIQAFLWEVDKDEVPAEEKAIFKKYNPKGSIPTFVFGCKYLRIGNGYEEQNDLAAEEAEFRMVIDDLLQGESIINE